MKTYLTGIVVFNNSKVGTGYGTQFLKEARPGDTVEIEGKETAITAVIDDVTILVDDVLLTSSTHIRLLAVNPAYILSSPNVRYTSWNISRNSAITAGDPPMLIGCQAFNTPFDISLQVLNTSKAVTLDREYVYDAPFTDCLCVNTVAGSQMLTLTAETVTISVTINSKIVTYVSGLSALLSNGMTLEIGTQVYTIKSIHGIITLDRPAHASYSNTKCGCPKDIKSRYPVGTYIVVNGRMCLVQNSTNTTIQLTFPIDVTYQSVIVRKPLMARQYSLNTVELFNAIDMPLLNPGDVIIVQDIQSPDSLFATNICYTEIKRVARSYSSNLLVTAELNKRTFTGIVCIGKPSTGVGLYGYCSVGNTSVSSGTLKVGEFFKLNDIIIINGVICKVVEVYGQYSVKVDKTFPALTGNSRIEYILPVTVNTYTPAITRLAYLQICDSIRTGIRQILSIGELIRAYSKKWYFAYEPAIFPIRSFGVYDPDFFAVHTIASPPTTFNAYFAVGENLSSNVYSANYQVIERLGLPMRKAN